MGSQPSTTEKDLKEENSKLKEEVKTLKNKIEALENKNDMAALDDIVKNISGDLLTKKYSCDKAL